MVDLSIVDMSKEEELPTEVKSLHSTTLKLISAFGIPDTKVYHELKNEHYNAMRRYNAFCKKFKKEQ